MEAQDVNFEPAGTAGNGRLASDLESYNNLIKTKAKRVAINARLLLKNSISNSMNHSVRDFPMNLVVVMPV